MVVLGILLMIFMRGCISHAPPPSCTGACLNRVNDVHLHACVANEYSCCGRVYNYDIKVNSP